MPSKERYWENPEFYREKQQRRRRENPEYMPARHRRIQSERKAFVDSLKRGKPCRLCGSKLKDLSKMTYHHPKLNNKTIEISDAVSRRWSEVRILTEIRKCILVCRKCHQDFHSTHKWNGKRFLKKKFLELSAGKKETKRVKQILLRYLKRQSKTMGVFIISYNHLKRKVSKTSDENNFRRCKMTRLTIDEFIEEGVLELFDKETYQCMIASSA